jgi:hypothetical protein
MRAAWIVAGLAATLSLAGCTVSSNLTAGAADGGAACSSPLVECNGECTYLATDEANCGACGNACAGGTSCEAGRCACPNGEQDCNGQCVSIETNNNNCGGCGTKCDGGTVCSMGTCACPAGSTSCESECVDTQTDGHHCGDCGTECPNGQTCSGAKCSTQCSQTVCGTSCVNTQTDNQNCGTCGTACSGGTQCKSGQCTCASGQVLYDNACCTPARSCSSGQCGTISDGCGGTIQCSNGCVTLVQKSDPISGDGATISGTLKGVASGDVLIALVAYVDSSSNSTFPTGVSDGVSYTLDQQNFNHHLSTSIFSLTAASAGDHIVTATDDPSADGAEVYWGMVLLEVSGLAAVPIDQHTGGSNANSGPVETSETGTLATNDEFIVALGSANVITTLNVPSGWVSLGSSSFPGTAFSYLISSAAAPASADFGSFSPASNWGASIATYKAR